jgi:hypothetical protein
MSPRPRCGSTRSALAVQIRRIQAKRTSDADEEQRLLEAAAALEQPFDVLLHQHGADQPGDAPRVQEDTDDVGPPLP